MKSAMGGNTSAQSFEAQVEPNDSIDDISRGQVDHFIRQVLGNLQTDLLLFLPCVLNFISSPSGRQIKHYDHTPSAAEEALCLSMFELSTISLKLGFAPLYVG